CRKVCPNEAPSITSFLAHIDQDKCTACGECIQACPRHSIRSSSDK
ncbi:MAG: 4Fe-4S binding protein, partial [Muribaculaceae bacterium]|nr:4Fe-4S binding protein [Muribaculaceae bacterium]